MKRIAKNSLCLALMLLGSFGLWSQQIYQFSQYNQNLYILNSATSGIHDYLDVNLSYRKQWVGITNSPTTYYISANMPLGKRLDLNPKTSSTRISSPQSYNAIKRKSFHAIGALASQDSYGPYTSNKVSMSYAYHLPVADNLTISFSPNVGFNSTLFDASKAQVELANDPTYDNYIGTRNQSSQMDINFAFWLYHPEFYVGYSSGQLLQDRLKLSNDITLENIKAHHNMIVGYHYRLSPRLLLTPSAMVRYVSQAPISMDINLRLDYEDRYWGGISLRNSKSLSAMLGLYLSNTFKLGYSFDYAFSALNTSNIGSHEVFVGLNLFNKEKAIF